MRFGTGWTKTTRTTKTNVVTEQSFRRFLRLLDREFDEMYRRMFANFDALLAAVKAENRFISPQPNDNEH